MGVKTVRYNVGIAYLLWLFSGCGVLGLQRFYLGKVGTGILWLCTGGLCGIGAVYDVFTLTRQVREANIRTRVRAELDYEDGRGIPIYGLGAAAAPKPENPEKTVLRVARKNGGFVTPGEAALEGDITVDQARKLLEKLAASGNAEMRVRSSGVVVYFFPEFARDGNDDFAV
jgi:TM2 domain-containing membrane protein YozV